MIKRESGFSLIEMMIAVAIVSVILASAVTFFTLSVKQYKTQTKITASGMEGIVGLEMLRRDLENMGFGLPWNNLQSYREIETPLHAERMSLNDGSGIAPRAIAGIDNAFLTVNRSDYFAIKSTKIGIHPSSGKWTLLDHYGNKRVWGTATENLDNTSYVTIISVGNIDANRRSLVNTTTDVRYSTIAQGHRPSDIYSTNIVYGIGDNMLPVRPFDRADYFVANAENSGSIVPTLTVPTHCAPGTGVLVKGFVNHNIEGGMTPLPLLDCVAGMKVVYGIDTTGNGLADRWGGWENIRGVLGDTTIRSAAGIREHIVEVRVSILAHEGQRDDSFTYPENEIFVGSIVDLPSGLVQSIGKVFNVGTQRNYRWRVYNLVVRPMGLNGGGARASGSLPPPPESIISN